MALSSISTGSVPSAAGHAIATGGSPLRGLKVIVSCKRTAVETGINQTYILNIKLYELDGNAGTLHTLLDEKQLDVDDTTLNNTDALLPALAIETKIRYKFVPYDSTSSTTIAQTGWIEVYLNGICVARLSPKNSIHPNSSGVSCGGDITVASASKWHAICFDGGANTTPTGSTSGLPCKAGSARFVRPAASVTPPTNPGKSDIVAFTSGQVDVGTLGVDTTLSACTATATAPLGREVQACSMLTTISAISASPRTYVFTMDGANPRIIDPIGKTINSWTDTAGVSPLETCRIIGVWRGRFFVANYDSNPTYWALSKIVRASNDATATDLWTTGGTDATRAFAGTASDSPGRPATAITAFAELDNGRAFMGCAGECFIFDGDPGYGGRLLKVSDSTGCLGPRAFCFDESGNLYFMGPSGLFMIEKGGFAPINVSGNQIPRVLNNVDTSTTQVQLAYDALRRTLMVFLTPRDGVTVGTHVAYETARKAPWKDVLPVRFGPTAVCQIGGEAPNDRRYLIGGQDGKLRRPILDVRSDDGDAVDCWIRYPTVEIQNGTRRLMVMRLEGVGYTGTGPAEWQIRTADSAAQLQAQTVDSDPAVSGTWFSEQSGFQTPQNIRQAGGAAQLVVRQVSSTDTLVMERAVMFVDDVGPRRV